MSRKIGENDQSSGRELCNRNLISSNTDQKLTHRHCVDLFGLSAFLAHFKNIWSDPYAIIIFQRASEHRSIDNLTTQQIREKCYGA